MTKKLIIGLSGLAGSGKDFVANLLVNNHGFVKIALADPLKRICQEVFDFSDDQLFGPSEKRNEPDKRYFTGKTIGSAVEKDSPIYEDSKIYLTPRFALQTLGTDWGRTCYPEVWTNYTMRVANKLLSGQGWQYDPRHGLWQEPEVFNDINGVVISDIRFRNEMEAVKNHGGKVVRIKRDKSTTLSGLASQHSSEQEQKEILDSEFDYVLNNQENLSLLTQEISDMLGKLG